MHRTYAVGSGGMNVISIGSLTFRPADFVAGLRAPFAGLALLRAKRRLRVYALVPIALNLVLTLSALVILVHVGLRAYAQYGNSLADHIPMESLQWIGAFLIGSLIVLAVLAAIVLSYMVIALAVCGYFFERLALETERELGRDASEFVDIPFWGLVMDLGRDIGKLAALNVALLFANFVPVVGSPVAAGGSLLLQGYVLGAEFLSFPMLLRGQRRAVRLAWCRQRFGLTVGLGGMIGLFLFLPIVNALLLTTAVVGAVLAYEDVCQESTKNPDEQSMSRE